MRPSPADAQSVAKPPLPAAVEPLQMIYQCRDAYAPVQDFTAVMRRRERIAGEMQPEETIAVKLRNKPFSVYFKWIAEPHRTREAIYAENLNDSYIVAHEVVGFVNWAWRVHPDSLIVRKYSSRSIRDAGIGNAIKSLLHVCESAQTAGDLRLFYVGQDTFDKRPTDVLMRLLPQKPGYPYHLVVLHIDRQYKLPVKFVSLNWDYEMETAYSYSDLKINVGLTDEDFNYKSKNYNFHSPVGWRALP